MSRSSGKTAEAQSPALLGAHVSTAGGVERAPARGAEIGAEAIQIFTKQVQRWAEPVVDEGKAAAFRAERERHGIRVAGSHDSYLINLASPDPRLRQRSYRSFCRELERCHALGLDFLVTHPGNATDGDRAGGIARNAQAIRRALGETECTMPVLIEATAGQGSALGCTFEELAQLLELSGPADDRRLGICLDTAHLFAAGYDLRRDYDAVMEELDRVVGVTRVRLFHLNDSKTGLGSHVDRHEEIGQGRLGAEPFRRIVRDSRYGGVPMILETPKGNDPIRADRRNLRRLRRYLAT